MIAIGKDRDHCFHSSFRNSVSNTEESLQPDKGVVLHREFDVLTYQYSLPSYLCVTDPGRTHL